MIAFARNTVMLVPFAMLVGCASAGTASGTPVASGYAVVDDASGHSVGVAILAQDAGGGVRVRMPVRGLTPGIHGVHFHAVGSCVAPAFASAGGHFNPESRHHGLQNPAGPHAGDLPNMIVDASGDAIYDVVSSRVSLTPGANSLFDADGSALVIHAAADDNMSDPAGNAGARVGCGEIHSGTAPAR